MKVELEEIIGILKQANINGVYVENTALFDKGYIDSFLLLDKIIPLIEHKFNIEVEPIDLMPDNFETPLSMLEFVERKRLNE